MFVNSIYPFRPNDESVKEENKKAKQQQYPLASTSVKYLFPHFLTT